MACSTLQTGGHTSSSGPHPPREAAALLLNSTRALLILGDGCQGASTSKQAAGATSGAQGWQRTATCNAVTAGRSCLVSSLMEDGSPYLVASRGGERLPSRSFVPLCVSEGTGTSRVPGSKSEKCGGTRQTRIFAAEQDCSGLFLLEFPGLSWGGTPMGGSSLTQLNRCGRRFHGLLPSSEAPGNLGMQSLFKNPLYWAVSNIQRWMRPASLTRSPRRWESMLKSTTSSRSCRALWKLSSWPGRPTPLTS